LIQMEGWDGANDPECYDAGRKKESEEKQDP
jgi:hypothetical protein